MCQGWKVLQSEALGMDIGYIMDTDASRWGIGYGLERSTPEVVTKDGNL